MLILKGHRSDKPLRSLAFSPDGTRLASSGRDGKTLLWDLNADFHGAKIPHTGAAGKAAFQGDRR
jgi:WD40 repeat protein